MMKKAFLFALAALCVSVAQAVTVNWSSTGSAGVTLTANQSCSIAYVRDFSKNVNETAVWIQFINQNNNNNAPKYNVRTKDGVAFFSLDGTSTVNTPIGSTQAVTGNEAMVFILNVTAQGNNVYTVDCYSNGALLNSQNVTFDGSPRFWVAKSNGAVIYDGALLDEQIAWLSENNTATIPEPTALALLALGVAGLALKRKVA